MIEIARELMAEFAERTGLTSQRPEQRYLWTDAYAVGNFLALDRKDLARKLVDRVHNTLGRHRGDDGRRGWLSHAGEARPTLGGLRIGKGLPERAPSERYDPQLEWDRDGQYFHYLTKWIVALDRFGDPTLHRWAVDLAKAAHKGFVQGRRMHWKMSIDLSRPLVPSMGQHDPLDGLVTYKQLKTPELEPEIASFEQMVESSSLETDDPLGLGGLFESAHRLGELGGHEPLRTRILSAAEDGLAAYLESNEPHGPAERRLAFRELGLAIGLRQAKVHLPVADEIVSFWVRPVHRRADSWTEHRNINDVMLATALLTRA